MLQEPHPRYDVSFAYALFTAILCWSTQRLRTDPKKDNSPEARAAANVWEQFKREPIALPPWNITIADRVVSSIENPPGHALASSAFHGRTADQLIRNLRDAVAHGDARKVEPYHTGSRSKPDRMLVGFRFKCEDRDQNSPWSGEITLLAADLVRIADEVARRFCAAMEKATKYSHLKEDAEKGVKEAA
jgi:hypothetical protein